MSNHSSNARRVAVLAVSTAAAVSVRGQELAPESGAWLRAGGVMRSGMKVQFHDTALPTPLGAGIFQNGYVLPSVGTNSPYTWNWGYQSASQITGNTLQFQRLDNAPRVGGLSGNIGSEFGGEFRGGLEVVQFEVKKRTVKFGVEGGYGYTTVSAGASGTASGTATLTTTGYTLVGPNDEAIIPPLPPFSGTFGGPGPLIPRDPISTGSITGTGTSALDMHLSAHLHIIKAGVYFETPLTQRLSAGVSFGYCTILPDAQLSFTESVTYSDPGLPSSSVSRVVRRSDWRPGGYFEMRLQYDFTKHLGVYVAGQVEFNQDCTFGDYGRQATIKLGGVYGGNVGVRWTF